MDITPVSGGIERIWTADNIAIVTLFLCLLFSGAFNIILLRHLLSIKEVLAALVTSTTLLNDKLNHD